MWFQTQHWFVYSVVDMMSHGATQPHYLQSVFHHAQALRSFLRTCTSNPPNNCRTNAAVIFHTHKHIKGGAFGIDRQQMWWEMWNNSLIWLVGRWLFVFLPVPKPRVPQRPLCAGIIIISFKLMQYVKSSAKVFQTIFWPQNHLLHLKTHKLLFEIQSE